MLAIAEVSPVPATISVLVKNSASKSLVLAEFAVRALEILVKAVHPAFFHEQHQEEQCLLIVHCLCEVMQQGQMKKVKYAKPALQHIETVVGGADILKQMLIKAYNFAAGHEEIKEQD